MKNKKIKVFNVINLLLSCAMVVFVTYMLIDIEFSAINFPVWGGLLFGIPFVVVLAIINAIRFIVEGIKTINVNYDLALNKKMTSDQKAFKIAFTVINVLLICFAILSVAAGFKEYNPNVPISFFAPFLYSSFALVPFVAINTLKFVIYKTTPVFAQNYKKPFRIVFISGNILLLCAMIIHYVIGIIVNSAFSFGDMLEYLLAVTVFYTFPLALFNGIKFIIDDIKSIRNDKLLSSSEDNQSKILLFIKARKKAVITVATIISILACFAVVFKCTHPTHYLYNDAWIIGKTAEQIQQRYGEYDEVRGDSLKGYCVREQGEGRTLKGNLRYSEYYMIYFYADGKAYKVDVEFGEWIEK